MSNGVRIRREVRFGGLVVDRKRNGNSNIDVAGLQTEEVREVLPVSANQKIRHIRIQRRAGETGCRHRRNDVHLHPDELISAAGRIAGCRGLRN